MDKNLGFNVLKFHFSNLMWASPWILDGKVLQVGGLLLLNGGPHEAENAMGQCRDTKLILAPNALGKNFF